MAASYLLVDRDKRTWSDQETVDTVIGAYSDVKALIKSSKLSIEVKKDETSLYGTYYPDDLIVYEISEMNSIVPIEIKRIGCAESIVRLFDRNIEQIDMKIMFEIFSNALYKNLSIAMIKDIVARKNLLSKQEKLGAYNFLITCTEVLADMEECSLIMDICMEGIRMFKEEIDN